MIIYLIKNNIKLMMRSATNVLLFIVTPIVLIAMLSSAFSDMMAKYESGGKITAGFRVEKDTPEAWRAALDAFAAGLEEESLLLREYVNGEPEKILRDEDLCAFVVFGADAYTIYQSEDHKNEGKIVEYAVGSFYERAAAAAANVNLTENAGELAIEYPEYMEPIDSKDYYGIIEIVYFGCCAIVCGAGLFAGEKKNRINKKFYVSGISEPKLYLAKLISMIIVVSVGSLIATALSGLMFGTKWGNPVLSALIVFLVISAATAFGLMAYYITDNMVATIISVFTVVWLAGFFGGSFETYMFSTTPKALKLISPLYHTNRALVELSCMGKSDYVGSAILYSVAIIVASSAVAVLAGTLRKRGRA